MQDPHASSEGLLWRHGKRLADDEGRITQLYLANVHTTAEYGIDEVVEVNGITVRGDPRTYDVQLTYNDRDEARIHALTVYEQPEGAGLDRGALNAVPLPQVTGEALAIAVHHHKVAKAVRQAGKVIGWDWPGTEADAVATWRHARQLAHRWTSTRESDLVARWRELIDEGATAIHRTLANEFGITPERSQTKISELRAELGEQAVPKARPGRPPINDNRDRT